MRSWRLARRSGLRLARLWKAWRLNLHPVILTKVRIQSYKRWRS
jgi:hypothetical protein